MTNVSWQIKCSSGCGKLPGTPLVVPAHDNVVHATVAADSWSLGQVTWYLRGGAKPLHTGG